MKEYYWTIECTGIIEAESYEDAKKELEKHAKHYVLNDQKYWKINIDKFGHEINKPIEDGVEQYELNILEKK